MAAIHVASFAGYEDVVKKLVSHKADVNLADEVSRRKSERFNYFRIYIIC